MSEIDYITNLNDWYEAATIHFSAMTTFVVLYLVGLYAFLRKAPMAVRVLAYVFFVGTFLVYARMGIGFLDNVYATQDLVGVYISQGGASEEFLAWATPRWYGTVPIAGVWYLLVFATVFALGWLTFFFRWRQEGEE